MTLGEGLPVPVGTTRRQLHPMPQDCSPRNLGDAWSKEIGHPSPRSSRTVASHGGDFEGNLLPIDVSRAFLTVLIALAIIDYPTSSGRLDVSVLPFLGKIL